MKQILPISTVFLFVLFLGCKQEREQDNKSVAEVVMMPQATENEIVEAVETFKKAMIDRDRELLGRICLDGLSYGHSSGLIQDKATFINEVVEGSFRFLTMNTPEQTILVQGDMAVVRHILEAEAIRDGAPATVRIGNVQIYKRVGDGSWKLWVRQAYKL